MLACMRMHTCIHTHRGSSSIGEILPGNKILCCTLPHSPLTQRRLWGPHWSLYYASSTYAAREAGRARPWLRGLTTRIGMFFLVGKDCSRNRPSKARTQLLKVRHRLGSQSTANGEGVCKWLCQAVVVGRVHIHSLDF